MLLKDVENLDFQESKKLWSDTLFLIFQLRKEFSGDVVLEFNERIAMASKAPQAIKASQSKLNGQLHDSFTWSTSPTARAPSLKSEIWMKNRKKYTFPH